MRVLLTSLFCVAVLAAVSCPAAEPSAATMDLSGSLVYFSPKDDDSYDGGGGLEIQGRMWLADNFGVAVVLGMDWYNVNSDLEDDFEDVMLFLTGLDMSASIDDTVSLLPIGASAVYRLPMAEGFDVTVQAGLRYVLVGDPELKLSALGDSDKTDIEIDNGLVGVIEAGLDANLFDPIFLFAGAGYQFDIMKGETQYSESDWRAALGDLDDNELEAWFIRGGAGIKF